VALDRLTPFPARVTGCPARLFLRVSFFSVLRIVVRQATTPCVWDSHLQNPLSQFLPIGPSPDATSSCPRLPPERTNHTKPHRAKTFHDSRLSGTALSLVDRRRTAMALLIYGLDIDEIGSAETWRRTLAELLPDLEIRIFPDVGNTSEITYLAFMRPNFDVIPPLPNLKAMFSRSAGVETFIDHPNLPQVPLGKIEPSDGDPMMTEYVIMHVLRLHREMPLYQQAQERGEWLHRSIVRPEARRVGFLGFGLMAKAPALVLKSLGFPVSAWVRSPKPHAEIPIFHGQDQFETFMRQTDIAVCLLPLTRQTEGILCARTFALMPKGSMIINIGRGKHVVYADLLAALDTGQLSYASLDALHPEPLPSDNPLWRHPKVTVMPHVARRPTVLQLSNEIVSNIRSIEAGGGVLQEIDKAMGY
jgi:glyoxylate/hydroxypyruvate reductase A